MLTDILLVIMKYKGHGAKESWPNLKYSNGTCMQGLRIG
jgi:hypothetical protein